MKSFFLVCFFSFVHMNAFSSTINYPIETLSKSGNITMNPEAQQNITNQLITVDSNDTAYAIWSIDGNIQVARRERTSQNYEKAITLSTTGSAKQPAIVASGTNIWACWVDDISGASVNGILIYKYTPQNGWERFDEILNGTYNVNAPNMASVSGDHVYIAFMLDVPNNEQIWMYRIIEGVGFVPVLLSTNNQNVNEVPQVAVTNVDPAHIDGCVVWSGNTPEGDDQAILARCFTSEFGSQNISIVDNEEEVVLAQQQSRNFYGQKIVFDNSILPVVAFHDTDHNGGVYAVRRPLDAFTPLPPNTGWVTEENPATNFQKDAYSPALARKSTGDVGIVYTDASDSNFTQIKYAIKVNGPNTWTDPIAISRDATKAAAHATLAYDVSNNGIVTFINSQQHLWLVLNPVGQTVWSVPYLLADTVFTSSFAFSGLQGQDKNVPNFGFEIIFAEIDPLKGDFGIMFAIYNYAIPGSVFQLLNYSPLKPQKSLLKP